MESEQFLNLPQFGQNNNWQWSKILKIMILVWRMQMWKSWIEILTMSLSHINATNAAIHLPIQAIWRLIWNSTMEKSQINTTNVTMHHTRQAIWGDIWKPTVERNQINATNVNMPRLRQVKTYLKMHSEKSQINAANVTLHVSRHSIWEEFLKCTVRKVKQM